MIPALVVLALGVSPTSALVLSQVVLSFGIPFALDPAPAPHPPARRHGRPRQPPHDHHGRRRRSPPSSAPSTSSCSRRPSASPSALGSAVVASDDVDPTHPSERVAGPAVCHVIQHHGTNRIEFSRETVEELLADGGFFWLDLDQPSADDFDHPPGRLQVPPARGRGLRALRPAGEVRRATTTMSSSSSTAPSPDEDRLVEVHCFYTERFLVTVHRDEAPALHRRPRPVRQARDAARPSVAAALPDRRRAHRTASSRSSPTSTTASTSSRTSIFLNADDSSSRRSSR